MEQLVKDQGEEFDIVDAYREAIDERNPAVEIDGQEFKASAILEALNPTSFSTGCSRTPWARFKIRGSLNSMVGTTASKMLLIHSRET